MGPGGAAAIQGGMQLVGQIGNWWQTRRQNRLQREWATGEADKKWAHDIQSRDYMNEYNSPLNQMQRMREAGLNPNLMYGQGTTGNQSGMPQRETAKGDFDVSQINMPNVLGMLNQYQEFSKKKADTDLTSEVANGQRMKNVVMGGTIQAQIAQQILTYEKLARQTNNERLKGEYLKLSMEGQRHLNNMNKAKANLWDNKINPNDPMWIRQAFQGVKTFGGDVIQWFKDPYGYMKKHWNYTPRLQRRTNWPKD